MQLILYNNSLCSIGDNSFSMYVNVRTTTQLLFQVKLIKSILEVKITIKSSTGANIDKIILISKFINEIIVNI